MKPSIDIVRGARFWLAWKNCIEFVEVLERLSHNTYRVRPTIFIDSRHRLDNPPTYVVVNTDLYLDANIAVQGRASAMRELPGRGVHR